LPQCVDTHWVAVFFEGKPPFGFNGQESSSVTQLPLQVGDMLNGRSAIIKALILKLED